MSGTRPPLSDDDRALLTPEELAQYDDPDYREEGDGNDDAGGEEGKDKDVAADDRAKTGDDDVDASAREAALVDDEAAKAAADAAAKEQADREAAEKEAADAAAAAAKTPAAPEQPGIVLPDWKKPEKADERLTEIDKQLDDIAEKFDNAEIDAREKRTQEAALLKEQRELHAAIDRANMAAEMQQAAANAAARSLEEAQSTWYDKTVAKFLEDHPEYAVDGSEAQLDFNAKVVFLQRQAVQKANGNPLAQFDVNLLNTAHEKLTGKKTPEPAPKREERDIPPTLNDVPAARGTDVGGEFSHLDRLEGEQLEAALSRLTPEQHERYMRS